MSETSDYVSDMQKPITTDAEMLAKVEAFCDRHRLKPTTFGRLAVGDGNLVGNLKAGRSLTLKLANRLVDFMASYRATPEPSEARAA